MHPDHVIEVNVIRKAYGPTVAADGVSFAVRRGEIFGLIDMDRPAALVERHCPQRTVVVATDFPAAAERFRTVPSATAVGSEGSRYCQGSLRTAEKWT